MTSARSSGAARLLICTDLRSSSVSCRAVTSVIAPAFTVICTCTAPKRVWTTLPAKVPAACAAAPPEPEEPVDPLEELEPDDPEEVPPPAPDPDDDPDEVVPDEVAADEVAAALPVSA